MRRVTTLLTALLLSLALPVHAKDQCKILSIGTGQTSNADYSFSAWFNKMRNWIYVDLVNKTTGTIEMVVHDWYVVIGNTTGYLSPWNAITDDLRSTLAPPILVGPGAEFERPFTPRATRYVISVAGIRGEGVTKIIDEDHACELAQGITLRYVLVIRDQEVRGKVVMPVQLEAR